MNESRWKPRQALSGAQARRLALTGLALSSAFALAPGCSGHARPAAGDGAAAPGEGGDEAVDLAAAPLNDQSPPVEATTNPIGSLGGTFSVSGDGAANYSLALEVPPGRAGMQPSLALSYSSRGGNGVLGVGWSLSAASQISPCGSNLRRDGELRPVQLDPAVDNLCLDGARLVNVGGNEYRTEPDSASKIVASSTTDAFGTVDWTVYTKDGRILRYGTTADARLDVQVEKLGTTGSSLVNRRAGWLLSRVEDRVGNYMTYAYEQLTAAAPPTPYPQLDWRIKQIDYAGHDPTGTPPNRKVVFDYEGRDDDLERFQSGALFATRGRLSRVTMIAPNAAGQALPHVRRYNLAYEYGSLSHRSRLAAVHLCDPFVTTAGPDPAHCLPPTRFTYSNAAPTFSLAEPTELPLRGVPEGERPWRAFFLADVDGDGRDDLVYRHKVGAAPVNDQIAVRLSNGTRFMLPQLSAQPALHDNPPGAEVTRLNAYDRDGDGRVDLVAEVGAPIACGNDQECTTWQSYSHRSNFSASGGAFAAGVALSGDCSTKPGGGVVAGCQRFRQFGDADGDLLPESFSVLTIDKPSPIPDIHHWLRAGADLNTLPAWAGLGRSFRAQAARVLDMDGDGAADLLVPYLKSQTVTTPESGVLGFDVLSARGAGYEVTPTDLTSHFFTGGGFIDGSGHVVFGTELNADDLNCSVFADVNGDGLADQVYLKGGVKARLNLGNGRFTPLPPAPALPTTTFAGVPNCHVEHVDGGARVVDYNQDGRADVLLLGKTTSTAAESARVLESLGGGAFALRTLPLTLAGVVGDAWTSQTLDADGDGLFDVVQLNGANLELYVQQGGVVDRLERVDGGLGAATVGVQYRRLSNTGYTTPTGCAFPERCMPPSAMAVVTEELGPDATSSATSPTAGTALSIRRRYSYAGGVVDSLGEGFLGFRTFTVTDAETGTVDRTTYDLRLAPAGGLDRHPFRGMPSERLVYTQVGPVKKATLTKFTNVAQSPVGAPQLYFTFTSKEEAFEYESAAFNPNNPGATVPLRTKVTTVLEIDDYQTAKKVRVDRDGAQTTTTRTVANDLTNWLIGLVSRETVESAQFGKTGARTVDYAFEPDNTGRVRDVVREPLGAADVKRCTRIAARHPLGLPTRVEVTPGGCTSTVETRATVTEYDADGTFETATVNALNQRSERLVQPGFGVAYRQKDVNGLFSYAQFDGFGRQTLTQRPDGATTTIAYAACAPFGLCVTATGSDGSKATAVSDKLGQSVRTVALAFDGRDVYQDRAFDRLGRLRTAYRPHFADEPQGPLAERRAYDELGRVVLTQTSGPEFNVVEEECEFTPSRCKRAVYAGLTTDTYDEAGARQTTRVNKQGLVESTSIYPASTAVTTTFGYGAFDVLVTVTDAKGNVVTHENDALGRTTKLVDKDVGFRKMTYDAFDQLKTLADPKGQTTTNVYDALGRLTKRTAPDGTDEWVWDTALGKGKGKLAERFRGQAKTKYAYDALGRPSQERWIIDNVTYDYDFTYDTLSRPLAIKYPTAPGRPRFTVDHTYKLTGYLKQVRDVSVPTSPKPLWTPTAVDADGQTTSETLGNGLVSTHSYFADTGLLERVTTAGVHDVSYAYRPDRKLKSRTDYRNSRGNAAVTRAESFTYDGAGRLRTASVVGRTPETYNYTYDDLGNLLSADDQGSCTGPYVYGGPNAGPHQLVQSTCFSTPYGHTYDANGNEILTVAPDFREQTWTSFDKVDEVRSRHGRMKYTYDADHVRIKKQRVPGALVMVPIPEPQLPAPNDAFSGVWDTTIYAGAGYEKRFLSGTPEIEHVYTVRAGAQTVGQMVWQEGPGGTGPEEWSYFHADRQGSVERTTDASGQVREIMSYSAWGSRRLADWTGGGVDMPPQTRVGYTGHAYDDEFSDVNFGLIDMGGRTYDAFYKRFLSPDPIVQAPAYGPSWNRYSYVFNDPLNYTDPTGHEARDFYFQVGLSTAMFFAGLSHPGLMRLVGESWAGLSPRDGKVVASTAAEVPPSDAAVVGVFAALGAARGAAGETIEDSPVRDMLFGTWFTAMLDVLNDPKAFQLAAEPRSTAEAVIVKSVQTARPPVYVMGGEGGPDGTGDSESPARSPAPGEAETIAAWKRNSIVLNLAKDVPMGWATLGIPGFDIIIVHGTEGGFSDGAGRYIAPRKVAEIARESGLGTRPIILLACRATYASEIGERLRQIVYANPFYDVGAAAEMNGPYGYPRITSGSKGSAVDLFKDDNTRAYIPGFGWSGPKTEEKLEAYPFFP